MLQGLKQENNLSFKDHKIHYNFSSFYIIKEMKQKTMDEEI